jgi:hypothetical protein
MIKNSLSLFSSWPRVLRTLVALCCGMSILVVVLADLAGRRYLRKREGWRLQEIAAEHARAEGFRRTLITEEPIDQNAAVWYRRSFSKLRQLQVERAQAVGSAIARAFDDDSTSFEALATEFCSETQTARVRDALRCTRCDWGLASLSNDDRLDGRRAWLLGNCLILDGHLRAARHQFASAAKSYLEALAFALDLGQADFSTSLVGMAVAKPALEGLGRLVGKLDYDIRLLEGTWQDLARFEMKLPSVDAGIRLARLRIATNLEIDTRAYLRDRPWVLNHVLPFRSVAAWRLSRSEHLLNILSQMSDTVDPNERETLATQIDREVTASTNQSIRDIVPDDCLGSVKTEEYLRHIYRATQAAIRLRQWSAAHGRFPVSAEAPMLSLEREGLRYDASEDGKGYKIVIGNGDRSGTVLLEQRSSAFTKPKIH